MCDLLGEEHPEKLSEAHPRVRVERTYDIDQFAESVKQADGAIVQANFRFPSEALKPDARLRWIQLAAAGADRAWTPELRAAEHVTITSSKGPMDSLLAEHTVLLMLALARNLRGLMKIQADKFWSRQDYDIPFMSQMLGKTIAILGVRSFRGNLASICKVGFGMYEGAGHGAHQQRQSPRGPLFPAKRTQCGVSRIRRGGPLSADNF